MKKIILLVFTLVSVTSIHQNCFAQSTAVTDTALTFVLSNEAPGYLIDNLIANGYGDSSLYSVLVALHPVSGGVISDAFLDTLAACPANSDAFTAELSGFSDPSNNPVAIGDDGSVIISGIYGRDYSVLEGYTTFNDTLVPVSLKLFTEAIGPDFYVDAGTRTYYTSAGRVTTNFKAFAIAWSQGSTFVLSNEGGLIDDLIRAGNGDKNLYQTLEVLKPKSGGVISDEFMATLAYCPAGSEIFSASLNNFGGLNNPVCVNNDGTLSVNGIFGKDYLLKNGYTTLPLDQNGYTSELFTVSKSAENYIDAGSSVTSGGTVTHYKAFAIAWKASTTFVLSNEGGLIDDLIRAGHGNKNLYQTLEVLKPKSEGVISDEFIAALANCPAGSEIFSASLNNFGGLNNPVCVNTDGTLSINASFGKDYCNHEGFSTNPKNQEGYIPQLFTYAIGPEYYINVGLAGTTTSYYKAFAIAWKASTTFVLSNEGDLIVDLIRVGNGDKNLYQTLEVLKPKSEGVISDEFIAALANCPAGSEIFTVALSNFNGLNNPVCVHSDGTMSISGIYGQEYFQKDGYKTFPENQQGYASVLFTVSTSADSYIDCGSSAQFYFNHKAFAIAWSKPSVGISFKETNQRSPSIYPNPFCTGFYIADLSEKAQLEIFDIRGKRIYYTEPKPNCMIQPGPIPKGMYILKLINSRGSWQQKIVKY